ncbi:hypothetical protein [Actinoplanes derwentensis]|uniref:Uncharacterized protein n=1 Tax=Actinoplanes derwentensis TaxID=113562 RepID=A0A1H1SHS9_9ACTN|nr:hypothetical protein [Actinoplanes derwentensis]GID83299.1 hypothetical protein Ade03nite_22230 [Actinoplanes derwentensis]SDS47545.1 hypothetical protein SAMN04489716_0865 [Actinoplanes derwentensis]
MEPSQSPAVTSAPRRTGRTVAVVALLLLFGVLFGRWMSPSLVIATDTNRHCDDASGYCVDHVTRGELLFLAPYDEFHVNTKDNPGRFYGAKNPFTDDADLTYGTGGAVSVTDGRITLIWDKDVLARLAD